MGTSEHTAAAGWTEEQCCVACPDESLRVNIPPLNFAMVCPGIYRGGYPNPKHFGFLSSLKIRTIVDLYPEKPYSPELLQFVKAHNIEYKQFSIGENREPFTCFNPDAFEAAMRATLDGEKPVLIHCDKGMLRTGCLVACLRKTHQWSMTAIFDEYRRFASEKTRP